MKRTLLYLFSALSSMVSFGQCLNIQSAHVTAINDGMNVNLKTISYCGAGFLGSDYTITDNVINLKACFWFNATLPVLTFDNDFFIPLENDMPYTLNLTVYNSSDPQNCDLFSIAGTYTTEFLSTGTTLKDDKFSVFPNPASNTLNFSTPVSGVTIFDTAGRLVKSASNVTNKIHVTDLPDGIYLLKAATENGTFSNKIIIHK